MSHTTISDSHETPRRARQVSSSRPLTINAIKLTALLLLAVMSKAYGHGGGLDSMGCHRQSSDNTYHCHQGVLSGQSFSSVSELVTAYNNATNPDSSPTPDPDTDSVTATAYNRDEYMTSWLDVDGNCRNTRHEVLAIESLVTPTFSANGCTVVEGLWYDPFTNQHFTNPSDLDIDHFVPLAEAHISGAWKWGTDRKRAFANDLLNAKALIAVSASANRSKGARDPAEWLPPNTDFHCDYVKDWTEVKRRYDLEMDIAEIAAIENVLGTGIEFAARAESFGWNENMGQSSSAVFGLGLRQTQQCAYTRQAASTDDIEITISILPEANHLDNEFNIFLVAELPSGLFSLNALGQFVPFTGSIDSLAPFIGNIRLSQSHEFTAFKGVLNEALTFNLFIGYSTSAGDFVYTGTPLNLSIVN